MSNLYMFMVLSLTFALLVVFLKNPVYAVFCLTLVFVNTFCILLCFQASEFLAVLILIVYVGAVTILFLFAVMMTDTSNISKNIFAFSFKNEFILVCIKICFILWFLCFNCSVEYLMSPCEEFIYKAQCFERDMGYFLNYYSCDIRIFGDLLYTKYEELFFAKAAFLLASLLIALILCQMYFNLHIPVQGESKKL